RRVRKWASGGCLPSPTPPEADDLRLDVAACVSPAAARRPAAGRARTLGGDRRAIARRVGATNARLISGRSGASSSSAEEADSVRVQLDAEELAADEDVVAVGELSVGLQTHVRAVAAAVVGEEVVALALLDAAMLGGHVNVAREVQVPVFATDGERGSARAD